MTKYEKPVMVTVDINVDESMLVGSIGYTSDEANKDYEVLSKERENDSEWGHLW
jgi:hypothetical protein